MIFINATPPNVLDSMHVGWAGPIDFIPMHQNHGCTWSQVRINVLVRDTTVDRLVRSPVIERL